MLNIREKDTKVGNASILAGALIRFDKVDEVDMIVLIDEFYAMYGLEVTNSHIFDQYINFKNGVYSVVGETELERFDSKNKLGEIQGDKVKSFIGAVNPEILVLKKIELSYGVIKDHVQLYNFEEIVAISKALNEGYLTIIRNDILDCEEIVITQRGRVRLFILDYCSEIEEFRKLLNESGYDSNLIYDFLMAQELDDGVYRILNLDNFFEYCEKYGRNRFASKKKKKDSNKEKSKGYKKVPKKN